MDLSNFKPDILSNAMISKIVCHFKHHSSIKINSKKVVITFGQMLFSYE